MKSKWWKPSKISWINDEEEVDYHRRKTMKNYVPMGLHNDSYKMFNGLVVGLPVARFFHVWQGHDVDKKF
ncbi:MAG: hypothetical protein MUE81_04965, partial [Thermoflexibacter sp.]|nr:hypothetical protein [Thermoflexibacter sp.]